MQQICMYVGVGLVAVLLVTFVAASHGTGSNIHQTVRQMIPLTARRRALCSLPPPRIWEVWTKTGPPVSSGGWVWMKPKLCTYGLASVLYPISG